MHLQSCLVFSNCVLNLWGGVLGILLKYLKAYCLFQNSRAVSNKDYDSLMPFLFSKFPVAFLFFLIFFHENCALVIWSFFLSLCSAEGASTSPPNSRIFSVVSCPWIIVSSPSCWVCVWWREAKLGINCHRLGDVTLANLHFQALFLFCLILFFSHSILLSMSWLNLDCMFSKMASHHPVLWAYIYYCLDLNLLSLFFKPRLSLSFYFQFCWCIFSSNFLGVNVQSIHFIHSVCPDNWPSYTILNLKIISPLLLWNPLSIVLWPPVFLMHLKILCPFFLSLSAMPHAHVGT